MDTNEHESEKTLSALLMRPRMCWGRDFRRKFMGAAGGLSTRGVRVTCQFSEAILIRVYSCLFVAERFVSVGGDAARRSARATTVLAADYEDRDVEFVTDRVDGVAEDQVLDAAVSMGAHDEQIGMDLLSVADDLFAGIRAVANSSLDLDLPLAQGVDQAVEIFA